jgi:hypothetical protein
VSEPHPNKDWAGWARMMAVDMPNFDMDVPGWAKCRIGNRDGRNADTVNWVFGIAKGEFGIWMAGYPICYHPQGGFEFEDTPPMRGLAALTLIRSGLGMGLFSGADVAVEAADMVAGLIDWSACPTTDVTEQDMTQWAATLTKVHTSWRFAGIDHHPHCHCHAFQGGPEHGIWDKRPNPHEDRPEKLS